MVGRANTILWRTGLPPRCWFARSLYMRQSATLPNPGIAPTGWFGAPIFNCAAYGVAYDQLEWLYDILVGSRYEDDIAPLILSRSKDGE